MKTTLYSTLSLLLILISLARPASNSLDAIKSKFSRSDCTYFEFANIIESNIFGVIDTVRASAYIAKDGRYKIEIGPDVYLYDGTQLYTYFWETNQVIIEKPDSGAIFSDEISFVMKLDEWYDSEVINKSGYSLTKKKGIAGDIPDSLDLTTNNEDSTIMEIKYIDINGDVNRIEFLKQRSDSVCDADLFEPAFPDSVEKVKL